MINMLNKITMRVIYYTLILLSINVIFFTSNTDGKALDRTETEMLAMKGEELSDKEAKKLEMQLEKNPNDLSIRIILLGYYFYDQFQTDSSQQAHLEHIMWIIENQPESEIAGLPYATIHPALDNKKYEALKKLWLKQLKTRKQNIAIIKNAANFFFLYDKSIAEDLLKEAQTIDPNNPKWSKLLGHLYTLGLGKMSDDEKKEAAVKSLKQLEKALNLTNDEKRFYMLGELAKVAFEADDLIKANDYATQLLNKASQYKDDWNYGNAVHHGNLILGRLALKLGDLAKAKEYLIEAGKTPGSPGLNSSGPNMALAKELLEKGEKEIVIKYFQFCANFWEMGKDRLKNWTSIVQKGLVPDFGANLYY